eukprot:GGOE01015783.1.p1 GENE.GGOE01015783.1~~GGOE01015783.1.p1  ORF type:complete len:226 (+),score=41.86 GGOE01015783.1:171-848(+)
MVQALLMEVTAASTASALFQRVYQIVSFADMEPYLTSVACVFIAAKVDNCFRKSRDVINVAQSIIDPNRPLPSSEELILWKEALLVREQQVLRLLGYHCHVEVPHRYLYNIVFSTFGANHAVAQLSTCLANDSFLQPMCLDYSALEVALAAMLLAAAMLDLCLPDEEAERLCKVFGLRVRRVIIMAHGLLDLYVAPPAPQRAVIWEAMRDWNAMSPEHRRELFGV